jgi:Tol biopolymer transport system component
VNRVRTAPAWSPDGRKSTAVDATPPVLQFDIYEYDLEPIRARVTRGGGAQPAVSPTAPGLRL